MNPSGVVDSPRRASLAGAAVAVAVVVALLLAACGGGGVTSVSSAGATTAPAATPTRSANATTVPSLPAPSRAPGLFKLVRSGPVIARSIVPARDAVLPGAIVFDDGSYHAWVVAFGSAPSDHDLLHLTSPDAVTWTIAEDRSLEALSAGIADPGAIPTSVVRGRGAWVMYFRGAPAADRRAGEVWRATAPSLAGPWSADAQPVLLRGPAGAWDSGGLDFPSVVTTEGAWTMLYSGVDFAHPEAGSLGLATSTDGITWAKRDDPATKGAPAAESDPVIEPGLCGGHDARSVQQPRLVAEADRLVVAYAGYAGALDTLANAGIADSADGGRSWTCRWPAPALDLTGLPSGLGMHTLLAFQRGERLALLFEWFEGSGTDIWLADAPLITD